jgi:hypothetical protein
MPTTASLQIEQQHLSISNSFTAECRQLLHYKSNNSTLPQVILTMKTSSVTAAPVTLVTFGLKLDALDSIGGRPLLRLSGGSNSVPFPTDSTWETWGSTQFIPSSLGGGADCPSCRHDTSASPLIRRSSAVFSKDARCD